MYSFISTKGRADIRAFISGLLMCAALPLGVAFFFAGLLTALYIVAHGLAGMEFGWLFIAEGADKMFTVTGALLVSSYLGAVMFFVLPAFQNGYQAAPSAFYRFLIALVIKLFSPPVAWADDSRRCVGRSRSPLKPGISFIIPSRI